MQRALRSLEVESENSCLFSLFLHRESDGKLLFWDVHNILSLLPTTNFLKHIIHPVSQPLTLVSTSQLKDRLQSYPFFISLTVVAVQWIILFHVLKQDSTLFGTIKMLAMLIKLQNPL